ncbi:hypothetical protein BASA81_000531 [Batrachochytrium salamandrivorans]|nr:hypothetical protein BASA81_000531 [Batrachochytrium salamandrivorans]
MHLQNLDQLVNCPLLIQLKLSHNRISTLRPILPIMSTLTLLELDGNVGLGGEVPHALLEKHQLVRLSLNNTGMGDADVLVLSQCLGAIKVLQVGGNGFRLKSLTGIERLEELGLSYAGLEDGQDMDSFVSSIGSTCLRMRRVDLTGNRALGERTAGALQRATVAHQSLQSIELDGTLVLVSTRLALNKQLANNTSRMSRAKLTLWIGLGDPNSPLNLLPKELLRQLVLYLGE